MASRRKKGRETIQYAAEFEYMKAGGDPKMLSDRETDCLIKKYREKYKLTFVSNLFYCLSPKRIVYTLRRQLFIKLMPKDFSVYMYEGAERFGTGVYDPEKLIGWGKVNVVWVPEERMDITNRKIQKENPNSSDHSGQLGCEIGQNF